VPDASLESGVKLTCPFCQVARGVENEENLVKQSHIVYQCRRVTAFVAVRRWEKNPGHILVIPNDHFEGIFDIPDEDLSKVVVAAKQVAVALWEVLGCQGILLQQHNAAAGGQRIFHFHLHVVPRFEDDAFSVSSKTDFSSEERVRYAGQIAANLVGRI
jgi:histidine triad (HIT) family protein